MLPVLVEVRNIKVCDEALPFLSIRTDQNLHTVFAVHQSEPGGFRRPFASCEFSFGAIDSHLTAFQLDKDRDIGMVFQTQCSPAFAFNLGHDLHEIAWIACPDGQRRAFRIRAALRPDKKHAIPHPEAAHVGFFPSAPCRFQGRRLEVIRERNHGPLRHAHRRGHRFAPAQAQRRTRPAVGGPVDRLHQRVAAQGLEPVPVAVVHEVPAVIRCGNQSAMPHGPPGFLRAVGVDERVMR